MLYLFLGEASNMITDPDNYFDYNFEEKWLETAFADQVVRMVDDDVIESPRCIWSNFYQMQIAPSFISGGAKSLILMYSEDLVIKGSAMGENCFPLLTEMGKQKDVFLPLNYFMEPDYLQEPFEITIMNNHTVIHTVREYLSTSYQYDYTARLEGPEDALQSFYIAHYKKGAL